MKSKTGWILAIVSGLVILFLLPSLLMGRFWTGSYAGMMGSPGMMGSFGFPNPFGFFGMVWMWLIPAGILVLLVLGVVALINGLTKSRNAESAVPNQKCANCSKNILSDWTNCPYCGTPVT